MAPIPLHPLLVHLPVVLIPLTVLMALPSLGSRRWFQATAPFTLGLSLLAAIGSLLATSSGDSLEAALGESSALLERHAELGELTRTVALVLFALLLVQTALYWRGAPAATRRIGDRHPGVFLLLAALVAVVGVADMVFAVLAGHAGAQLVWQGDTVGSDAGLTPAGDAD